MSQLRRHSLLEASLNTLTGFVVSYLATFAIYPLIGIRTSAGQNFWIVTAFTGISVVRSYYWRRIFNWYQHRHRSF